MTQYLVPMSDIGISTKHNEKSGQQPYADNSITWNGI